MNQATPADAPFAERRIDAEGATIRCLEAGQGSTVVVLRDGAAVPTALERLLAGKFHVIVLEAPQQPARACRDEARILAQAVRGLGVERYALVGSRSAASQALWQTIDDTGRVEALVLISPTTLLAGDAELEARLGDVAAPTLVLVGTDDKSLPAVTGRMYVERIGECYHMLVYDAGPDPANERPAALFEAVADFVERRGAFVVERRESAINP